MIVGRVVAGLGGGGINAISTFVANDLISLRSRGMVQGFANVVFGAAVGLGGVMGGAINDLWGWRWAFLILVPPTILSTAGNAFLIPGRTKVEDESAIAVRLRRIDFLGSSLLTLALALLLWSLNYERTDGLPSGSVLAVALPLSGGLLVMFALIETWYATEPVIPMQLLKVRNVSCASLAHFFNSMAVYMMVFYIPIYWQVRGSSTTIAGVRMLPEPVGSAIGSLGSGLIMRRTGKYGMVKVFVLLVLAAGCLGYSFCDVDTFILLPEIYLFMIGLGFTGSLTTMLLATLTAVENEMQAVVTGVLFAGRAVGATIGVTASGFLFRQIVAGNMPKMTGNTIHEGCRLNTGDATACSKEQLEAYMLALRAVFLLAASLGVTGLICGSLTENFDLHGAPAHKLDDGP